MTETSQETQIRFHSLEGAKAVLLDVSGGRGDGRKDRLIDVGLRDIAVCPSVEQLPSLLAGQPADLLFVDLDNDQKAVCRVVQDIRSQNIPTDNPFLIVIGLTRDLDRETVAAALQAGVDDLLSSPLSGELLRECLRHQIDNRKDFIATSDYVGPDQRDEDREASNENLISIAVPNSLRHKAGGDPDAVLDEALVAGALRALALQRCWHLARQFGALSTQARTALDLGGNFPLLGEITETLVGALRQVEKLVVAHGISEMSEIIASARAALLAIQEAGEGLRPRHFELLRLHADGLILCLKTNDADKAILVTELERAVAEVRGLPSGKDPGEGKKKSYPLKIRLAAWWDGVDPADLLAAQSSS